jgi:DnaJ-class molecular chaperone
MASVSINMLCTLEELYTCVHFYSMVVLFTALFSSICCMISGCVKRITFNRRRFSADGMLRTEEKTLTVEIRPGYRSGTKITFPGEGDEEADVAAADICVTLQEAPHERFTRLGALELQHAVEVSLADALAGATVQLTTLDGRLLSIPISEIV